MHLLLWAAAAVVYTIAIWPYIAHILDPSLRPVSAFASGMYFFVGVVSTLLVAFIPGGDIVAPVSWLAWWAAAIFAADCGARYDIFQQLMAHYHGVAAAAPREAPEHHAAAFGRLYGGLSLAHGFIGIIQHRGIGRTTKE
ncbi:hypothetical protein EPN42_10175 [bacterium]|nr:MAG: hypothetical protein EPN42_10175 [bacterium]